MQAPASRFTVQIAAYTVRASAEALRSTISAAGHDAYIVENEGPPGTPRYRVRVGSYPTREAAIAAATRLPGAGARYVTSR
jgi:DedD protein